MSPKIPQLDLNPENATQSPATRKYGAAGWFYFLVPSVADLIFILLLFGLTYGAIASRLLGDAGIGWHIRNGQQILRTHSIPRVDPFSSTMSGQTWYAWEWLYDAGIALVHNWLGLNGVVLATVIVIAATFALALRLSLRRGTNLSLAVVLLLLALGASSIHFFARPHVLSWLFSVLWFQLLDSAEMGGSLRDDRSLYWLPVLMLVWVNLHGGFVFGFALLGLYSVGNFIQYFTLRDYAQREVTRKKLTHLVRITALSLVASLANPYGYKLHLHVYGYLSDRWLMNHIDEFLSPNFHGTPQECFAALLMITMLAVAVARQRLSPSQLLVIIFAAFSGLYASRNLPVSSLLLVLMAGPLLSQAVAEAGANPRLRPWLATFFSRCQSFASRMGKMEFGLGAHLWPALAIIIGVVVCLEGGRPGSFRAIDAHFDGKRFPVQAIDVIEQRDIREPIFTPDSWGGYLIYRLYPQKVFVDDRHDFYGADFFRDYLKVIRVTPDWDKMLNERQLNWVLAPAGSSLANILRETRPWNAVYEDETAVLLKR